MESSSITILGGDFRQCYVAEYLCSQGWQVGCFHTPDFPFSADIRNVDCLSDALEQADLILAPTPLKQYGVQIFQSKVDHTSFTLHDLLK